MQGIRRTLFAGTVGLVAFGVVLTGASCMSVRHSAWADEGDKEKEKEKPKKSVEACDVYVGDYRKWEKPAEVNADDVYAKIDEYKEIVDKGLKSDDPKYEILMCKASKKFLAAVKKAGKDGSYDLVAKKGSVKGVDSVPDITSDAIAAL